MFLEITLENENATLALGKKLAQSCKAPCLFYLSGNLGAGKTTLVRGFLQGLNYKGTVKSPTFTFVESYQFKEFKLFHYDLYRLAHPEELEFMGFRDYFSEQAIHFIEWPEKAENLIPAADVIITLQHKQLERIATIEFHSEDAQKHFQHVI